MCLTPLPPPGLNITECCSTNGELAPLGTGLIEIIFFLPQRALALMPLIREVHQPRAIFEIMFLLVVAVRPHCIYLIVVGCGLLITIFSKRNPVLIMA